MVEIVFHNLEVNTCKYYETVQECNTFVFYSKSTKWLFDWLTSKSTLQQLTHPMLLALFCSDAHPRMTSMNAASVQLQKPNYDHSQSASICWLSHKMVFVLLVAIGCLTLTAPTRQLTHRHSSTPLFAPARIWLASIYRSALDGKWN